MTRIIEKRRCLHRNLTEQQQANDDLKSQITGLQSLANIGSTTCMIAHEINNLLTPLASYATLALNNPDDKKLIEKALQKTVRNCERASKIMESMLAIVNGQGQEKEETRLADLVEDVFGCLCRDFSKDGITVKIDIPDNLKVWAVPVQIQQVLMNLILNARDAMLPGGGILTIRAGDDAGNVQIEIADTGCGIESADLEKIFEPFYTTKTEQGSSFEKTGCGLGLVFCKQVIDNHGGTISVESEPAKASTFKITLPKQQ